MKISHCSSHFGGILLRMCVTQTKVQRRSERWTPQFRTWGVVCSWPAPGPLGLPVTVLYVVLLFVVICTWRVWKQHIQYVTVYSLYTVKCPNPFCFQRSFSWHTLCFIYCASDCSRFGGSDSWIPEGPQRSIHKGLCRILPQFVLEITILQDGTWK